MRPALALALLMASTSFTGCVLQQLEEAEDAEVAYQRCVVQNGEGDPECTLLQERKRQAQRRYEDDSKRLWGCHPQQEECPTKR